MRAERRVPGYCVRQVRRLPPSVWLILFLSTQACVSVHGLPSVDSRQVFPDLDGVVLGAGDVVVALDRSDEGRGHELLRIRHVAAAAGDQVVVRQLAEVAQEVTGLAVSADARWLALEQRQDDGSVRVSLHDLGATAREELPWASPFGCKSPTFGPSSGRLYLLCAPRGRQPASLLEFDLADGSQLSLVGERPRTVVAVGVEGDLYWVEEDGGTARVVRRPRDQAAYPIHTLYGRVRALWPQRDGSLVAEYGVPGAQGQLARLLPSGLVRDEPRPRVASFPVDPGAPTFLTAEGRWLVSGCAFEPCGLLEVLVDEMSHSSLHLRGRPTAVTAVPRFLGPVGHVEDLATAPASVLLSHSAAEVSVLGVRLKTPLETAFSTLDRGGRHPYWISAKGKRGRPGGIGVGWTTAGYCISFLADERGIVGAIELQGCAAEYLSPQLNPLLRREHLSDGALEIASQFLGPGVSVSLGGSAPRDGSLDVQRTRIQYHAPDRGYEFEAEIEVMSRGSSSLMRSRLLSGQVRLRLQSPGRPQASILGVP